MESQGKKIKVPSPCFLNEQFSCKSYLADFANNTGLVSRVGGRELSAAGIKLAIKTSVIDYQNQIYKSGGTVYHLHSLEKEVKDIVFG